MSMQEGLEVTIQYCGTKCHQVASSPTASSALAILKRDLAHLRVHSPSQKNVRRVNGSFILHWPTAERETKRPGLANSLYQRWFRLCSDDPDALKLRTLLSIESITLVQDGVRICATAGPDQASQDVPPGTPANRPCEPLSVIAQQPVPASISQSLIPPPSVPSTVPRFDRQTPPHMKRMSDSEGSPSQTGQELDIPEPTAATTTSIESIVILSEQAQPPMSPIVGDGDAIPASPQPMEHIDVADATPLPRVPTLTAPPSPETQRIPTPPSREPGEMTPQPSPPGPGASKTGAGAGPVGLATRPPPSHSLPCTSPRPTSPYVDYSSGNGDLHGPRRGDRDVNRLMCELWDTRCHLTAMQARERVLLDDLERLGIRPESVGGTERNGVSREEHMMRLEADLKAEKARRARAERVLSDVERECRTPFVVPALLQAFLSISELSS